MKILISDPLSQIGIERLQQTPNFEVDINTGLSQEELHKIIGKYDALIIRSATNVTREIIEEAHNLKVIGRAGIGLDNVDIPAASQQGIVVMNTPDGNTITAAEHTIAMILSLTRNIPQGTASLKEEKWEKKKLKGRELFNKTLGIIGAGHIGRIVADRAKGLKMKVIVHDPYITPKSIKKLDLEPVSFEELLKRSDYITVHTPKTDDTANLINKSSISKMKKGAMIINCARGGIVNEDDIYDALKDGHLGGVALDVFATEPPGKIKAMEFPNFICTPHLGASTKEAQDNVAIDVADQIINYLNNGTIKNAVNVPSISSELMNTLYPYLTLVEKLGALQSQLADTAILKAHIHYEGNISEFDVTPLTTAMLKGLLTPILKDDINFVNAPVIAAERGIKVVESKSHTSEDFASMINLEVQTLDGTNIVAGTNFGNNRQRIIRINSFYLEAIPEGHNLLIHNLNRPNVIGQIGTIMGDCNINISRMQVGEEKANEQNVILLTTATVVDDEILDKVCSLNHVFSARRIDF